MEYLLNEEQKKFVESLHEFNEKNNIKNTNYNTDIFYNRNNKKDNKSQESIVENTNLSVELKNETFFNKLISFIKNFLKKDN